MAAVTFDPVAFKARYPEFAAVNNTLLAEYFVDATMYLSNTDRPCADEARRLRLFNMLVAHIAYLAGAGTADGQPRPVGRLSQASEGSVSASFENTAQASASWFQQSQYGAAYWQATKAMRSMRYIPCPTRY